LSHACKRNVGDDASQNSEDQDKEHGDTYLSLYARQHIILIPLVFLVLEGAISSISNVHHKFFLLPYIKPPGLGQSFVTIRPASQGSPMW